MKALQLAARLSPLIAVAGVVIAISQTGCDNETYSSPTSVPLAPEPAPTPAPSSFQLWSSVLSEDGQCLVGAVVEVLSGPLAGQRRTQDAAGCQSQDSGDGWALNISDLPSAEEIRLRASALGHVAQVQVAKPKPTGRPYFWYDVVYFSLSPE